MGNCSFQLSGNNITDDPIFLDRANDNYRLHEASRSINAGSAAVYLTDEMRDTWNIDHDDFPKSPEELLPELDLIDRQFCCHLDLGAYEYYPDDFCPGDVNGSGVVNVDDLLAVINAWGPCQPPPNPPPCLPGCPADVAPIGCPNNVINVDDLLTVIGRWGSCPDRTQGSTSGGEPLPDLVQDCLSLCRSDPDCLVDCLGDNSSDD